MDGNFSRLKIARKAIRSSNHTYVSVRPLRYSQERDLSSAKPYMTHQIYHFISMMLRVLLLSPAPLAKWSSNLLRRARQHPKGRNDKTRRGLTRLARIAWGTGAVYVCIAVAKCIDSARFAAPRGYRGCRAYRSDGVFRLVEARQPIAARQLIDARRSLIPHEVTVLPHESMPSTCHRPSSTIPSTPSYTTPNIGTDSNLV